MRQLTSQCSSIVLRNQWEMAFQQCKYADSVTFRHKVFHCEVYNECVVPFCMFASSKNRGFRICPVVSVKLDIKRVNFFLCALFNFLLSFFAGVVSFAVIWRGKESMSRNEMYAGLIYCFLKCWEKTVWNKHKSERKRRNIQGDLVASQSRDNGFPGQSYNHSGPHPPVSRHQRWHRNVRDGADRSRRWSGKVPTGSAVW